MFINSGFLLLALTKEILKGTYSNSLFLIELPLQGSVLYSNLHREETDFAACFVISRQVYHTL